MVAVVVFSMILVTRGALEKRSVALPLAVLDVAVPMPEYETPLDPHDDSEGHQPQQAQVDDQGEYPRRVKLRGGDTDQLAESSSAAKKLARNGARHHADRRYFHPCEELRETGGDFELYQCLPPAGADAFEQHPGVGIGRVKTRGCSDDHGKNRYESRKRNF